MKIKHKYSAKDKIPQKSLQKTVKLLDKAESAVIITRHSTLDTRHSTLDTRHSTLDTRHSLNKSHTQHNLLTPFNQTAKDYKRISFKDSFKFSASFARLTVKLNKHNSKEV